jgi:prephenate dehydrogenase
MKIHSIGIIGFGRFGRFAASQLNKDFHVYAYSRGMPDSEIKKNGAIPSSLKEVCSEDILLLAVPISAMEELLLSIKGFIAEKTIVVDVCSVKEYPVMLMKKILPKKIRILATHPLFGPDSSTRRKIVLCKVRLDDKTYLAITNFLLRRDFQVIETTPQEHDFQIAKSLLLTHFIGRALAEMGAHPQEIDTSGYNNLMSIMNTVGNDSWQLFEDMNFHDRFSGKVRKDFMKSLGKIERRLR